MGWTKVVFWICPFLGLAATRSSPYSYHLPHSSVTFIMGPQALQHPILSNHLDVGRLKPSHGKLHHQQIKSILSSSPNSVHPNVAVPGALLGHNGDGAPSPHAAVQLFVQDAHHVEQEQELQSVQQAQHVQQVQHVLHVQPVQHQKPDTFFHPGSKSQMSGNEGKPSEEDIKGFANKPRPEEFRNVNSLQLLKTSENSESDRIGNQMRASDISTSGKQSGENSEFSESVRQMTIYREGGMVANKTEGSLERSSLDTKAQLVVKPADSRNENEDLLKERLASLQRQLDATLRQLATSKRVEPRALFRGAELFEEAKGRMLTFEPRTPVKGTTLPHMFRGDDFVEDQRMFKDPISEDGGFRMAVADSNSLQGEPIRYFYFI